jgi:nitrite reductase/ring-hydroxylating ferredoxin subunit
MNRKEFLSQLGIGAAFVLTTSCLGSCKKETAATTVDMTIDLTNATFAALKNNDSYVVKDGIVIAKTKTGTYIAATVICSHDDLKQITLKNDEWFCTEHSARFDQTGKGLNNNGSKGLTVYKTTLTGTSLRVYS